MRNVLLFYAVGSGKLEVLVVCLELTAMVQWIGGWIALSNGA